MQKLRKRAGFASLFGSIVSPFEFESDDSRWTQLAQLEAVVEFYANLYNAKTNTTVNSVWATDAKALDDSDQRYRVVSFRELEGSAAKLQGPNLVHLDGEPDLRSVIVNPANNPALAGVQAVPRFPAALTYLYDTLWLDGDSARSSGLYRIMGVDNSAKTVTLDGDDPKGPNLSGSSKWKIHRRPILVMIDPFGPRRATGPIGPPKAPPEATVVLQGENATVNAAKFKDPDKDHRVIILDGVQHLERVNPNFDTIYLPSDTVEGTRKPWRTYRITAVDPGPNHTVTVAGQPVLSNNSSAWQIPAGVGGQMPDLVYALGPAVFDHYDAMLFIVYRGKVTDWFRWSSYSSCTWLVGDENSSSLAGNDLYYLTSFRSGEPFKNYCFKVTDVSSDDQGIHAAAFDGVKSARFYFETPIKDDSYTDAHGNPQDNPPKGKRLIRIHDGSFNAHGSGSAGCLVSPKIYDLRDALIRIYQQELLEFCGPGVRDAEVQKAYSVNLPAVVPNIDHPTVRDRSQQLWKNTEHNLVPAAERLAATDWVDKLAGLLWLVRPDEIPLP